MQSFSLTLLVVHGEHALKALCMIMAVMRAETATRAPLTPEQHAHRDMSVTVCATTHCTTHCAMCATIDPSK